MAAKVFQLIADGNTLRFLAVKNGQLVLASQEQVDKYELGINFMLAGEHLITQQGRVCEQEDGRGEAGVYACRWSDYNSDWTLKYLNDGLKVQVINKEGTKCLGCLTRSANIDNVVKKMECDNKYSLFLINYDV